MGKHDREKSSTEKIIPTDSRIEALSSAASILAGVVLTIGVAVSTMCVHGFFNSGPAPEVTAMFSLTGMSVPVVVPSGLPHRSPELDTGPAQLAFSPFLPRNIQQEELGFQPLLPQSRENSP